MPDSQRKSGEYMLYTLEFQHNEVLSVTKELQYMHEAKNEREHVEWRALVVMIGSWIVTLRRGECS